MQMCPPGYHYISIVIPALGHWDVRLRIHWLNLSNEVAIWSWQSNLKDFKHQSQSAQTA